MVFFFIRWYRHWRRWSWKLVQDLLRGNCWKYIVQIVSNSLWFLTSKPDDWFRKHNERNAVLLCMVLFQVYCIFKINRPFWRNCVIILSSYMHTEWHFLDCFIMKYNLYLIDFMKLIIFIGLFLCKSHFEKLFDVAQFG